MCDCRELLNCGHPKACLVKVIATNYRTGEVDDSPVCEFCAELEAREEKLGDLREKIRVLADKWERQEQDWTVSGKHPDCESVMDCVDEVRELLSTLDPPATVKEHS